ncbi:MAG: HAD-IIB family hydrolase [Saprospiraceae bacterium]|nr:HAD-IIB family hydrolase [Saprospiraceae bacterium]
MQRKKPAVNHDIKLLSFDIDNTLVDLHTLKGKFTKTWLKHHQDNGILLTYNSGRLYKDVLGLIKKKILPEPAFIIGGVGTHIYDFKGQSVVKEFRDILEDGWNLSLVEEIVDSLPYPIELQPRKFQHDFKRSYFFHDASPSDILAVEEIFEASELDVNVVYSSDQHLDILPKWANKGNSLKWLLDHLQIAPNQSLVAGDSANDSAMFEIKNINGIAVSNAREELYKTTKYQQVYHSERAVGEGVVEGLVFYGVLPEEALEDLSKEDLQGEEFFIQQQIEQTADSEEDERLRLIHEGYEQAILALKKNISPLGFLACPIEHNVAHGTDENYHSVWARDGAITIIGALSLLHHEDIHACVRQTFDTLLQHISVNGQLPANVQLKDGVADYSGVGGICSIDSGLWVIIALYEYIHLTEDLDFLKKHLPELQKAMNWLSAQDGNNDALLEIPEAGDWTDLFGRSYHVLYDEILWYRTNVCFGRLQEMLGSDEAAGDYIRWSQVIKKEILSNFWPSTQQKLSQSVSFAEHQFSLGDTKYLVAQITPFDFSWRCDSYGNILAFLYDVTDSEKALSAFRFMLGVGINEPFPIRNVYPVVSPGDPDWRAYYTVNLLNLPDHYHNGGVWPFIGALWVQFIDKLGQREMAINEMYKLALLNKAGVSNEWEFNEWAHGKTGRPMGKTYQAWSAAQYIAAYYRLNL